MSPDDYTRCTEIYHKGIQFVELVRMRKTKIQTTNMRQFIKTIPMILLAALLVGCNASKRIVYDFNKDEAVKSVIGDGLIRIKPYDRLTVIVSSQNPELASPFNAPSSFHSVSPNPLMSSSVNGAQSLQIRTVDENGFLEMPIIGKVNCNGKTRNELAADIAKRIIDGGYISDAFVNIQFADMKIFVQGCNLFSLDNIGFADPEQLQAAYPSVRTWWAGVKFNF